MNLAPANEVRALGGPRITELYWTGVPQPDGTGTLRAQARALYSAVGMALRAAGARILAERVFATVEAMKVVATERRLALGDLDDGVRPTRIVVAPGRAGPFAGVQVHAVSCPTAPEVVRLQGAADGACGRRLQIGQDCWLALNEVVAGNSAPPSEQARLMFDSVSSLLRQSGADMKAVARTWLWLKDICDWYADFNAVRTAFFKRERLLQSGNGHVRLPASTGIGLGSAGGAACALDLIALPGREDSIELLEAGGDQDSAFKYGSAFSRAAIAPMPGGRTLFVSGTAAVDAQGRTEHVGQVEAQIHATIRHVRSLLAKVDCGDEHVLSALVYCKTPQVEESYHAICADLKWPRLSMIAEICRPDLLFEVEVVAGPVPRRGRKG